ncbi:hypothetical protein [Marinicella sp. W31]|uniref:hypothetical protein n=1 Tax=Marinicella sp. W31 TaxID=3023713 RepID=UPI0037573A92
MNRIVLFLLTIPLFVEAQEYPYEPSTQHPDGKPHPQASAQIKQYAPMIGLADCTSETRLDQNTWAEPIDMTWRFKYIMNGMAVQDETLKADGKHSGSIRQFDSETQQWFVHYYNSSQIPKTLPAWQGALQKDKIVLLREQKSPNGLDGFYRLTFYNIDGTGYQWVGEWVDSNETIVYPTWKINCKKRQAL